jgi:mannose-6-phosphate isomerase-like protein (cupin superfamily)
MKVHDVQSALDEIVEQAHANPRGRANADFGMLNDYQLGLGRYTGQSPWERHRNGDELLYVMDGEVEITLLSEAGAEEREILRSGSLFVVPRDRWHRLDTSDGVSIFFASPPESGAERTGDDPRGAK